MNKAEEALGKEWYERLHDEFSKQYMIDLSVFIKEQKSKGIIYPPSHEVFNAYKLTPYDKVKVCIIGQDPYINEFEAHGLAFSTYNNQYTPSLRQIEKRIREEIYDNDVNYKWSNNLERWSKQGVMLLNRVLTVNKGDSNSHKGKGWENFTAKTVMELDSRGIIFLLWGKDAQTVKPLIKWSDVIECEHPVAGVYQGRLWANANCFKRTNEILKDNKIIW